MKKVTIYTDGACSGNPGPGGWGAVLMYNGVEKEMSGAEKETTNNRTPPHITDHICISQDFQAFDIVQNMS